MRCRQVRGKTMLAPSRTQPSFAPSATVEPHRARTQATFAPSATVEAPKGDKLFDLSEDDFDLVQVYVLYFYSKRSFARAVSVARF
jgi:hypothetical protein